MRSTAVPLLLVLLGAEAAAQSLDPAQLGGSIEHPVVVRSLDLGDKALPLGRGQIQPSPATRAYLLAAQGIPCGVWLQGPASFSYRVEDTSIRPIAERNLRSAANLSTRPSAGALQVTFEVQEAVLWGWEVLPSTPPSAGEHLDMPFSPWALEVGARDFDDNPARDLLLARANRDSGYVYALLRSSQGDFVLDVDPRPHVASETLSRLKTLPAIQGALAGRRVHLELVTQPIGRAWGAEVAYPYAVTRVRAELVNDRGAHVRVKTQSSLTAARDGLQLLSFGLNDFLIEADGGIRQVTVAKVSVDGQPAPFRFAGGSLLVALSKPLRRGETAVLETEVEGDFAQRPGGDNYWAVGPVWPEPGDHARSFADYEIVVEVPQPFVPFASGETVERTSTATTNRLVSRLDGGFRFPVILAGKYRSIEQEHEGFRVRVSSYAKTKETEARRLATNFFAFKECYENWFGVAYPFRELDILEINSWGFGVAPAGVIYITREAFTSQAAASASTLDEDEAFLAAVTSRGVNERFAHEVAHGFFPHIVRLDPAGRESWLSESLAEYASAVCVQRSSPTPKEGARRFARALREWKDGARELRRPSSIYFAEHLAGEEDVDGSDRHHLLYAKGPLVLHAIRQELGRWRGNAEEGDKLFFVFMRAIVRNFDHKIVATHQLPAILRQMTQNDWQPFFDKYVYGVETPTVK